MDEVTPEVATLIVASDRWSGNLPRLAVLAPEVAAALAAVKRWDGQLPGVTAFERPDSVAVATALAKRIGPLALPNLKKISPKTLSALIATLEPIVDGGCTLLTARGDEPPVTAGRRACGGGHPSPAASSASAARRP